MHARSIFECTSPDYGIEYNVVMLSGMHQDFWTIHKDFRYTSLKLMSDNAPLLNDGQKIHKYIEYSKHT